MKTKRNFFGDPRRFLSGMTLLEILVALGLMSILLGFIWGMVTLFSKNYLSSERRIGRAQLVRSISQTLSDDLGAAVQDPIHPLQDVGNDQTVFVRRFGLRGDATSLQIDVVEPNLLVETATVSENRAAAATSSKPIRPQVPELKTVFYEFVPLNALQDQESEISSSSENGGSEKIGSLQTPTFDDQNESKMGGGLFGNDRSRLVRKFGLSRRELNYEAPDPTVTTSREKKTTPDSGLGESNVIGSLITEPDSFSSDPDSVNAQLLSGAESRTFQTEPFLTAPQIAMEIDDGTVWIPEVVACRFRYFDGNRWFLSWDSIQRGGLPTAIEIQMKLIPLDDVETIRTSPYLSQIAYSQNDFATGGLSIDNVVNRLGLSAVMTRNVVTYLPTTPLSRHHALGRRKPLPAVAGQVASSRENGAGSRRVSSGEREGGRTFQGREAAIFDSENSRPNYERSFGDREALLRSGGDGAGRTAHERLAVERSESSRENEENFFSAEGIAPTPNSVDFDSFGGIDSLMSGFDPASSENGVPGMVPTAGGISVPTQTTSPAPKKTGTQQSWIRGKR